MFRKLTSLFAKPVAPQSLTDDPASLERENTTHLLASETLSATDLLSRYPPRIEHAKKQLLFDIALSRGLSGDVSVARYSEIPLPNTYTPFVPDTEIIARKGYFRYSKTDGADDWFMNFAHHDLFNGYGHFMFAQDEIQVAEHPALASFRELMLARDDDLRPATVDNGVPTPVLFRNLQRTVNIDTRSIYGARFARSEDSAIQDAVSPLEPAPLSNILAIEAPISSGNRIYGRPEIEAALRTAYSGFRALVLCSATAATSLRPIILHTGNWGCGAYGGNRQLMLSIQMMAARLAGVTKLVFYCGADNKDDIASFSNELSRQFKFRPGIAVDRVVDRLVSHGFPWGTPDGN